MAGDCDHDEYISGSIKHGNFLIKWKIIRLPRTLIDRVRYIGNISCKIMKKKLLKFESYLQVAVLDENLSSYHKIITRMLTKG